MCYITYITNFMKHNLSWEADSSRLIKIPSSYMGTDGSLPGSQEIDNDHYQEPD
jgi:hypothetical protein